MTRHQALALLVLLLVLPGCVPAEFENPLSDPGSAAVDSSLAGVWACKSMDSKAAGNGKYEFLHIGQAEGKSLQIILVDPTSEPAVIVLKGFVTKLPQGTYLNVQQRVSEDLTKGEVRYSKTYWILKYEVSAEGALTLRYFDDEQAKDLIGKGKLEGSEIAHPGGETALLVKSSSSQIAQVIRDTNADSLFAAHNTYRRLAL